MRHKSPNEIVYANNHAEIVIGDKRALFDLHDLPKVQSFHWQKHPRGPIMEDVVSKEPRQRVYKLAAMVLYGHAVSFKNGDRYDLRRANVFEHKPGRPVGEGAGIYRYQGSWYACLKQDGTVMRRCFSIAKYGEVMAKQLALEARAMIVKLDFQKAAAKWQQTMDLRRLMFQELRDTPTKLCALRSLAEAYTRHEHLPIELAPHLHRMLVIGGGRLPKLYKKKDLGKVNIYEGNADYENCVPDIPFTEDGHWDGYHQGT